MQYLIDRITPIYNWLSYYYYGDQKVEDLTKLTPQEKVLVLRKVLKQQCIYPEEIQGKIQMQFTKVIASPQYQRFSFTTRMPPQYPVPKQLPKTKTICFFGQFIFKSDKIKCPLVIHIVFEDNFPQSLPKFYVNYPSFPTDSKSEQTLLQVSKPNTNFVQIIKNNKQSVELSNYNYQAMTGGIEVLLPQRKKEWKLNLKQLIDECVQMMRKQFPFIKSKSKEVLVNEQTNMDAQTQKLYQMSQKLQQKLKMMIETENIPDLDKQKKFNEQLSNQQPEILKNCQSRDIIQKSLTSQIKYLQQQNQKLLNHLKMVQKDAQNLHQNKDFSQTYPVIVQDDPLQKELFDLLVNYEATKDCLIEVERQIKWRDQLQHKIPDQSQFKKIMKIEQQCNEQIFLQRYKIDQLVKTIQQRQKQE